MAICFRFSNSCLYTSSLAKHSPSFPSCVLGRCPMLKNLPSLVHRCYSSQSANNHESGKSLYFKYMQPPPKFTQGQKNKITIEQHNYKNKRVDDIALNNLSDNPGSKQEVEFFCFHNDYFLLICL